ncbi:Respiratory supercomplex factor 2 mitochondrial [Spathaspora sp. JA1]|nr:Respiratory supercomplex factor 2 mitochondrial [Spathaspora sp. JA1]
MKIISEEEKYEHQKHILIEGLKGCAIGAVIGFGMVKYMKIRQPVRFARFNSSIKAAMYAMPAITVGAFYADQGSVNFDEDRYRSDYLKKQESEALERYNKLSTQDKILHKMNENKYSIIVSAWAASLYGSWTLVNRDKFMSKSQKIVQARVYAQAITVVLLLGTILLSMHEAELKKKEPAPVPEWKRYLDEQEALKKEHKA